MSSRVWLDTLTDALRSEAHAARLEHDRRAALPLADRVALGFTWSPLRIEDTRRAGPRTIVRLLAPRGVALHDGISSGDPVVLGSPAATNGLPGWVVGSEGRVAEISLTSEPDGLSDVCAVSLRFDPTTWQRYAAALVRAAEAASPLRDVLLGALTPSTREDVASLPLGRLNAAQHRAGTQALAAGEIALIHGPPGTGKTELVVSLLGALVARGEQPWALAASNAAVDHLALRAAASGLTVVRLGHPLRVTGAAQSLTLDHRIASGPHAAALTVLDRDLGRLRASKGHRTELRALSTERRRLRDQARAHILRDAQVIASTLGTLARVAPDLRPTDTAIVDEATQAMEPAIWTAVPYVQRLILVGDPHQLGPVVRDNNNLLERSLVQRLLDDSPLPMAMLQIQHRMSTRLQALVQPVYGPDWQAHPSVAAQTLAERPGVNATTLTTASALWVDTAGAGLGELRDPVTQSLYNPGEIEVIVTAVQGLLDAGVSPEDIGVLAPYSAQVGRLRLALPAIEVATVNAFQGREKEAILCSFVRSNDTGELGFVADGRRLTVALSRARRFVLAVGDSATLAAHRRFADVIDQLAEADALVSVFEPPWDAAVAQS